MIIRKIISGAQTGVDRAALDFAIENEIPHGGWVPRGRMAEDGPLPARYNVRETETASYNERTEKNILDSDGTLILGRGSLNGGSALTRALAREHKRPCLHLDLGLVDEQKAAAEIARWIRQNKIRILNVAGPRASKDPQIYSMVMNILKALQQGAFKTGKETNMSHYKAIFLVVLFVLVCSPCLLRADENHINVEINPEGIADEEIKLRDHELKTREYLQQKAEKERAAQSAEFCKIADMYYANGEIEKAVAYYEKALAVDENNILAHKNLIKAARERDEAELKIGAHYHNAMDYLRKGFTEKAVDELVLEIKENPDNKEAQTRLNEIESRDN